MVVLVVVACTTEKNTFVTRTYHGTTARFNGYFNATELVRIGLEDYRKSTPENYYEVLPIERLPNEDEAVTLYPALDTAISKCSEVIGKHAMPNMNDISRKKDEWNNWIDENWIMIGKAEFYKTKYDNAREAFEYVRLFYVNDPSKYTAMLWLAKCDMAQGDLTSAGLKLRRLDALAIQIEEEHEDDPLIQFKKDEDAIAEFPKRFEVELAKTKAELELKKKDEQKAIQYLIEAVGHSKDKDERARLNFIIAQLYAKQESPEARTFFTAAIKKNSDFEMIFYAKINRALAGGDGDEKIIKELKKMLKDAKNLEYKDQIYYALADIALDNGDEPLGMSYLTQSVFYSLNNNYQKGISYERMGTISYDKKDYVRAQKYYDSSANVLPDDYAQKELILNKANKLSDLVRAIDLVNYEDSVQRIAKMDESARADYLKDLVKQLEKEEKERKEAEARRLEELRALKEGLEVQNNGQGGKWYFNNSKSIAEGFNEFRRIWGQREDEDNWRRSNKIEVLEFEMAENDSIPQDSIPVPEKEEPGFSVDKLMADLPLTDSLIQVSNEKIMKALYTSGMIYKNQLLEKELAVEQFKDALSRDLKEDQHDLLSAFQLYEIHKSGDPGLSSHYRSYIMNNYPNSDYANYLRDPDYFKKKKEMDKLNLEDYLRYVKRYEQGMYYPVITKAKKVIAEEPDNEFRSKYMLLQAMATGQVKDDKTEMLPVLQMLVEEFPGTPEAERASELIGLIKNGVPANEPVDFSMPVEIFNYDNAAEYYVMVYLVGDESTTDARTSIANFNREFFGRERLRSPEAQIYSEDVSFVVVKKFKEKADAEDYVRVFKRTKKHLGDLQTNKIIYISPENYRTLLKDKKLKEYEQFFNDNY